MQVFNILTGKQNISGLNKLISLEKKSSDYILSIPHGGIFIPVEFINKLNIRRTLITGSDLFTDKVYDTGKGIVIISRLNRFFVNMSRFREGSKDKELHRRLQVDPLHELSPIDEEILKEDYSPEEREKALAFYDKYHELIEKAIKEMKKEHGYALMFDCHSMDPIGPRNAPDEGKERPDFTAGSFDDRSASMELISVFYETLKSEAGKLGFTAKKNDPYKGGFITQNYGKPSENIHVLQLEINKSTYMQSNGIKQDVKRMQQVNSIIRYVFETTFEYLNVKT